MEFKTIKAAEEIVGGLSSPSKMPGLAYGLPAKLCSAGTALREIPGSVCSKCYAMKGRYGFPAVQDAQLRRYDTLENPLWTDAMVWLIQKKECKFFRWHDSGDLKDIEHLARLVDVARRCPDTKFWLPTRETKMVSDYLAKHKRFPKNLIVRVSAAMIDGDPPAKFNHTSTVVSDKTKATCPAYKQDGKCGDCRQCWNPGVKNVSYPRH